MVTELFGREVINISKEELKEKIRALPPTWAERRSYLLHDWSAITGVKMTAQDFKDVGGVKQ